MIDKLREIYAEFKKQGVADPLVETLRFADLVSGGALRRADLSVQGEEPDQEVRTTINEAVALWSARTRPPDLILLNISMPEMDGYEICEQLQADERTRDVPVIFLSASDELVDKVKAFKHIPESIFSVNGDS